MQCNGGPPLHPTLQPRDGQECTRRQPSCQVRYTVDAATPHAFAVPHVRCVAYSGFVSVTVSSNRSSPISLFEQTTTLSCDGEVASRADGPRTNNGPCTKKSRTQGKDATPSTAARLRHWKTGIGLSIMRGTNWK